MHPLAILINVAASVLLLLWAVRLVRSAVESAYGRTLREMFRASGAPGLRPALAGSVLAIVLQSSTAVVVLSGGFAAGGLVPLDIALATLIGAHFGSAVVVKILSFDLSLFMPMLVLVGAAMYLKLSRRKLKQLGQVILGIGFVLMSLGMLSSATAPLRDSPALPGIVGWLSGDPVSSFLFGTILTMAVASSVGTLLLLLTLTAGGVLPIAVAAPMVFGANLGNALTSLWITRGLEREGRVVVLGGALPFAALAVTMVAIDTFVPLPFHLLGSNDGDRMVHLHLLFNLVVMLGAIPLVPSLRKLAERMIPDPRAGAEGAMEPRSALDPAALGQPSLALTAVRRELLRMGETIAIMLVPVPELLENWTPEGAERIRKKEGEVDRIQSDVKLYLAALGRKGLSADDARRASELASCGINLEHAGDIIATNILRLAEKKASRELSFSTEGWQEILRLHARVSANLDLALNVLISGDVESARTLVREKAVLREMEQESHRKHLARLQSGKIESIETSGLHLEAVRSLKEINSAVVTVAYPILSLTGQLLPSRLAEATHAS